MDRRRPSRYPVRRTELHHDTGNRYTYSQKPQSASSRELKNII